MPTQDHKGSTNGVTTQAEVLGFTITGGATPKTLTVTASGSIDEAVALSSKAPKAAPAFTGQMIVTTAGADTGNRNPTNDGIFGLGGGVNTNIPMTDNQSFTITLGPSAVILCLTNEADGSGAVIAVNMASATITALHDPTSSWVLTDSDAAKMAVFKGANSRVITIKNYTNATAYITANILGVVSSTTAVSP